MRDQQEGAVAEVDLELVGYGQAWRHYLGSRAGLAEEFRQALQIMAPARRQSPRQLGVPDEYGAFVTKGGIAEDVVRVHVGVDHITDR